MKLEPFAMERVRSQLWDMLRSVLRKGGGRSRLKDLLLRMPDVGKDADFDRIRQKPRRVRF